MKKNILLIFYIILILLNFTFTTWSKSNEIVQYHAIKNDLEINADAAILIDATTGEILFEKNSNKREYPASITKIMTALLAFEANKMNEIITFSHNAIYGIEPGSSHIALQEEEQITMEQAIYALLLRSANEAALGIAEQIDASVEKFAEHMTTRAKELGCKNTNFVNPHGLHDENHYTTAYDMALIAKEALKFQEFRKIIKTIYYEIPPTNKQNETRYLYGQHQMIKPPSIYVYEGCEGGKTGFTNEAQNTLVTYAKRDNTELIAVVFQCKGVQHYEDTIKLFDYGFSHYKTVKLSSINEISQAIPVVKENDKTVKISSILAKPTEDIYETVPIDFDINKIKKIIDCPENLVVPINKNDTIATVTFYYENIPIKTVELLADHSVILEENVALASLQNDKKISNNKNLYFNSIFNILIFAIICSILSFLIIFITYHFILWRNKKRIKRKKRLKQK
ncbi:D-alanyl-D-alanine carboxypeptidase family protein [Clostridium sp. MD294]|uniref:D-alanyl-D-alanine carboxypeptidase family protein n=1 Tax=Clostridium sp. MD294 TaxID=97138 RepID=UPI0002CBF9A5|nr:D-alanyl-D-alanine carboxypeptidase family protein [Clostridium sp. MD294]NDO45721.1 D-alanyl-D-alanine carboxypeptidase [Clostridium sp. MD294]USF30624.1 hypothetical protein C820_002067 [Clostridium sp. MD294]